MQNRILEKMTILCKKRRELYTELLESEKEGTPTRARYDLETVEHHLNRLSHLLFEELEKAPTKTDK